jgi:hypothetical protein
MKTIIEKPLAFLAGLFYLVFPMFDRADASRHGDSAVRWLGRMLVVGVILAILAAINQWAVFGLSNVIRSTVPWVGRFWLPLLALCLYALLWLGWWLYRLLMLDIEPPGSDFPDIDRAWSQALEALGRAGIVLDMTPLFLVLGWPSRSEDDLFRAAGIKGPVCNEPNDPTAPLHVTATRDGIWLTCPGASLLARYGQVNPGGEVPKEVMATMTDEMAESFKTMGMGPNVASTLRIEDFQGSFQAEQGSSRSGRVKPVEDPDRHLARLRHLCRLVVRDRQGFCPTNGVLVTLPLAVDARAEIAEIADACRKDLATVFDTFRMRCSVLVLVGGLEQVAGFAELVERLPAEQVRKRMGQRFPLVPGLSTGELSEKVQESAEVVSGQLFPSMIHTLFQVETKGIEDADEVLHANFQLFRFLYGIVERGERLARLIKDCLPTLRGEPIMFGGCYFAGTGRDAMTEQAFASGVLMRLIRDDQDHVTWTAEVLEQDAASARLADRVRMVFALIIALGVLAAAGLIARHFPAKPAPPTGAASSKEGLDDQVQVVREGLAGLDHDAIEGLAVVDPILLDAIDLIWLRLKILEGKCPSLVGDRGGQDLVFTGRSRGVEQIDLQFSLSDVPFPDDAGDSAAGRLHVLGLGRVDDGSLLGLKAGEADSGGEASSDDQLGRRILGDGESRRPVASFGILRSRLERAILGLGFREVGLGPEDERHFLDLRGGWRDRSTNGQVLTAHDPVGELDGHCAGHQVVKDHVGFV